MSLREGGVYVHIPFCVRKCTYCDFASFADLQDHHQPYVDALLRQINSAAPRWQMLRFVSLFLGGGTPTVLSAAQIGQIVCAVRAAFAWEAEPETTIEANPGTLTPDKLLALRAAGINRLSLGVQSWHAAELRLLGRIHSADEALAAVEMARQAGFDNLSLDLIYGLPGQTVSHWQASLKRSLALAPEHLSLYGLSLEKGTPLAASVAAKALPKPDADVAADMYTLAEELLAAAGYQHYEISNWARRSPGDAERRHPLLACRHNLLYWNNQRYLGLGSAAASYDGSTRTVTLAHPVDYIAAVDKGTALAAASEMLSADERLDETIMLGLRLVHGLRWQALRQRFGCDVRSLYAPIIAEQRALGLLEADDDGMRLTARGRLMGNRVFAAFLRGA